MLRNWVTQFGYASGRWAGDEGVAEEDRRKFIGQIGNYFGWNPPTDMNWMVEVAKDNDGKYVMVFMRYATDVEAEKMLGKNYEKYEAARRKNFGLEELPNQETKDTENCGSTCLPFKIDPSIPHANIATQKDMLHHNVAFTANSKRPNNK
jgi:hypothetical protein